MKSCARPSQNRRRRKTSVKPSIAGLPRWAVWNSTFRRASRCPTRRASIDASAAIILIDTNVISELTRRTPSGNVLGWFGHQDAAELHLSAVSEAELRHGAAILGAGRRRQEITAAIEAMIAEDFAGRVLPFDSAAAVAFAEIFAGRRAARSTPARPMWSTRKRTDSTLGCRIGAGAASRADG